MAGLTEAEDKWVTMVKDVVIEMCREGRDPDEVRRLLRSLKEEFERFPSDRVDDGTSETALYHLRKVVVEEKIVDVGDQPVVRTEVRMYINGEHLNTEEVGTLNEAVANLYECCVRGCEKADSILAAEDRQSEGVSLDR